MKIKGNVLIKGELFVTEPLIITGEVRMDPDSVISVSGEIIHNGGVDPEKVETYKD